MGRKTAKLGDRKGLPPKSHFHSLSAPSKSRLRSFIQFNEPVGGSGALRLSRPPPAPPFKEKLRQLEFPGEQTKPMKTLVPPGPSCLDTLETQWRSRARVLAGEKFRQGCTLCFIPKPRLNSYPRSNPAATTSFCPCRGIGSQRPSALSPAVHPAFCLCPMETWTPSGTWRAGECWLEHGWSPEGVALHSLPSFSTLQTAWGRRW